MFGIGPMELIVIAVIAIIFIGPQKLPEVMQKVGRLFVQLRRQTEDIRSSFQDVVRDAERELELEKVKKLRSQLESMAKESVVETTVKDTINEVKDSLQYHESHYVDGEFSKKGEGFLDADELNRGAQTIVAKEPSPENNAEANDDPFQDTTFSESEDKTTGDDPQGSATQQKPSDEQSPEKPRD
jgi:sec-independent protein translocase protein TatB